MATLTTEAQAALQWYATNGQQGTEPSYGVLRALIAAGYVSAAGAITEKGRHEARLSTRKASAE